MNNTKPHSDSTRMQLLRVSWSRCCEGLKAFTAKDGRLQEQQVFEKLWMRYTETSRQYHSLQHLLECITHFEEVAAFANHPAEVEMALWFHDAVYEL